MLTIFKLELPGRRDLVGNLVELRGAVVVDRAKRTRKRTPAKKLTRAPSGPDPIKLFFLCSIYSTLCWDSHVADKWLILAYNRNLRRKTFKRIRHSLSHTTPQFV